MKSALFRLLLCSLVLSLALPCVALAAYPDKPIKLISHAKPGGGMDLLLRQMSNILEQQVPVPLVVENKAGGGSAVAVAAAVTARNPGYTVLGITNTHVNTPLMSKTPYSLADLKPLCFLFVDPLVMVTAIDQPWKTAHEFLEDVKQNPGKRSVGASQIGSAEYIIACSYTRKGYPFALVPFEAGGELITAMLGKHVDVAFAEPSAVAALEKAGKLRVLATFTKERLPAMPDVPTMTELGLPEAPIAKFRGLMVQKNTPDEAFDYLYNLVTDMMKNSQAWKDYLAANSQIQEIMTPEQFTAFLDNLTTETKAALEDLGMARK